MKKEKAEKRQKKLSRSSQLKRLAITGVFLIILGVLAHFVGVPVPVNKSITASEFVIGEKEIRDVDVTMKGIAWVRFGAEDEFKGDFTVGDLVHSTNILELQTGQYLMMDFSETPDREIDLNGIGYADSILWNHFGVDVKVNGTIFTEGNQVITYPQITAEEIQERLRELRRMAGYSEELIRKVEEAENESEEAKNYEKK